MSIVNHLKNKNSQNLISAVAYGKHVVTGNLTKSLVTGSSPTHVTQLQQMLGRGPWDGCEGLWWNGVEIKPADYRFYPGELSSGMSDPTQGLDTVFDSDTPHSGFAWLSADLAAGFGEVNNKSTPPEGLSGIFRTMKCWDFDDGGTEVDLIYSTNPALQVADLILRFGDIPKTRIDWESWCEWRDYLAEDIEYDYTALPGFEGIGLTASLYNGVDFDHLVTKRIDPVIEFSGGSGSPGVGVDVDHFSVTWEGQIKSLYNEEYSFYLTHTHGARLFISDLGSALIDEWATSGTHTSLIKLGAGILYNIRVEWKHTTGDANLRLEWESESQNKEVISHRSLYPLTEERPRYETHPFFAAPTRLDDAVRTVLNLCNSTVQERYGKLHFFCLDSLASESFTISNAKIVDGSVVITPRDVRSVRNSWQARFRDIDSQYLSQPVDPVVIERPDLMEIAGRKIDGEAVNMFNTTHHQAYRTLDNIVRRVSDAEFTAVLTGTADTWQVLAGDRIQVEYEFLNAYGVDCLVLESNDSSSEDTADERTFTVQPWPTFQFTS